MQSKAATVSEYLKELPADRRAVVRTLRAIIHRVDPKAAESMQHGMPVFGEVCAVASQKHYMALYVCDPDLVKTFRDRLGKVNCGKVCIRFRRLEELDLNAVERLLREVVKRRQAGIGPDLRRKSRSE